MKGILCPVDDCCMRISVEIDEELLKAAIRLSGHRTRKATIGAGLSLLLQIQQQAKIRKLRGKVRWEGDLNQSRLGRV